METEVMKALRNTDNTVVTVIKNEDEQWVDTDTKNIYILHEDIELLY